MLFRSITNTDKAPAAIGPYSQAISYGSLLFTSGQIPLDPVSGNVTGDNISAQAEQVIKNISAVLTANGIDFTKVSRPHSRKARDLCYVPINLLEGMALQFFFKGALDSVQGFI